MNIEKPELGNASAGELEMALGPAFADGVVSLGDGGSIVVGFDKPISDGPGADFAVFENGFSDTFLELAFVSVSSDGIHFYTFPSDSETDTSSQLWGFGELDPKRIHNLAGKYKAGFGTPFDLSDLPDDQFLTKNSITHIRITDVVGNIDPGFASRDSKGHRINDPYPTAFPTGGFDLDAIGVINESVSSSLPAIWPNPVTGNSVQISGLNSNETTDIQIINVSGKVVRIWNSLSVNDAVQLGLPGGIYFVQFYTSGARFTQKLLIFQK